MDAKTIISWLNGLVLKYCIRSPFFFLFCAQFMLSEVIYSHPVCFISSKLGMHVPILPRRTVVLYQLGRIACSISFVFFRVGVSVTRPRQCRRLRVGNRVSVPSSA